MQTMRTEIVKKMSLLQFLEISKVNAKNADGDGE